MEPIILISLILLVAFSFAFYISYTSHSKPIRLVGLISIAAISFSAGITLEKILFVNRHIDLCTDETSEAFLNYGGHSQFCKQVL